MDVLDVIEALEKDSRRSGKLRTLRQGLDALPDLRAVLRCALDPYMRFYLRRVPDAPRTSDLFAPREQEMPWAAVVHSVLEPLARREVTGNAAVELVADAYYGMPPRQQDVFRRVLLKDLRCGVNTRTVNEVCPGLIPTFAVQLASPFSPDRATWPLVAEPKVDGMRVLAVVRGTSVEYLSRGGRPVRTLSHLSPGLIACLPEGGVVDGEAVSETDWQTHERSMSAVKRGAAREDMPTLLVAFDLIPLDEWDGGAGRLQYRERRRGLEALYTRYREGEFPGLRVLPSRPVDDEEDVNDYFGIVRQLGYEGLILKDPSAQYEFRRSHAWMKVKASDTTDVVVTGFQEGRGKYRGQLGALLFEHDGQTCRVGAGFSDAQRSALWRQRNSLVGETIEVEHTELTAAGRTRHARFVRFRSHDGERD